MDPHNIYITVFKTKSSCNYAPMCGKNLDVQVEQFKKVKKYALDEAPPKKNQNIEFVRVSNTTIFLHDYLGITTVNARKVPKMPTPPQK